MAFRDRCPLQAAQTVRRLLFVPRNDGQIRSASFPAEEDILACRQEWNEIKFLIDDRDAGPLRILGRSNLNLAAIDANGPAVGNVPRRRAF